MAGAPHTCGLHEAPLPQGLPKSFARAVLQNRQRRPRPSLSVVRGIAPSGSSLRERQPRSASRMRLSAASGLRRRGSPSDTSHGARRQGGGGECQPDVIDALNCSQPQLSPSPLSWRRGGPGRCGSSGPVVGVWEHIAWIGEESKAILRGIQGIVWDWPQSAPFSPMHTSRPQLPDASGTSRPC